MIVLGYSVLLHLLHNVSVSMYSTVVSGGGSPLMQYVGC